MCECIVCMMFKGCKTVYTNGVCNKNYNLSLFLTTVSLSMRLKWGFNEHTQKTFSGIFRRTVYGSDSHSSWVMVLSSFFSCSFSFRKNGTSFSSLYLIQEKVCVFRNFHSGGVYTTRSNFVLYRQFLFFLN